MKPGLLIIRFAALLLTSAGIIFQGASQEPYIIYKKSDALVQVGLASAVLAFWICTSVQILIAVREERLTRIWRLSLLVIGIVMFYVSRGTLGYLTDLEKFAWPLQG